MTGVAVSDWNPETYARFRGLRLRPALDLLAQVPDLPGRRIVDLGCGNGPVGQALRARFADSDLTGVDASPAMLAHADETGQYDRLIEADAAQWRPDEPLSLIFSNALCQWLPDHPALFARLAGMLMPGGVLAVQMPGQSDAPSHALIRAVAARLFPDRFAADVPPPVATPAEYHAMLAPLGTVSAWETTYVQRLDPVAAGHPVRGFTESTYMRPYSDAMSAQERSRFLADYETELARHYPAQPDGSVLFPFRRVFFTLIRPQE